MSRRAPSIAGSRPRLRAFTLIELLVVVAIMGVLLGMAMTLLTTARRVGQRINSESVLRTVQTALRLFQRDVGVLPYQSYPASASGITPDFPARNGLARRLGHTLTASERGYLNAAVGTAAGKFAYNCDLNAQAEKSPQPSALTYRQAWTGPVRSSGAVASQDRANDVELAYIVNRLAMQRARLATQAGALDLPGPIITQPGGSAPVADLTGTALLGPADAVDPGVVGWCDDYLDGALDAHYRSGDDIVDSFGHPILLIDQVLPKIQFSNVQIGFGSIGGFDSSWFGLGASGFRPGTGPWNSIVAAKRWRLLALGRIRLSLSDAGDGHPTPADPTYLPTAGNLFSSDRRFYAAPGLETDCELWSAGPRGMFGWMRDTPGNEQAIPCSPVYDRGLR